MVAFLSFLERLVRARSFYPKERISFFDGVKKVKAGIGKYLSSIFVFNFEGSVRTKRSKAGKAKKLPRKV